MWMVIAGVVMAIFVAVAVTGGGAGGSEDQEGEWTNVVNIIAAHTQKRARRDEKGKGCTKYCTWYTSPVKPALRKPVVVNVENRK